MKKIAVIGAGMMGQAISMDLYTNFNVKTCDISEKNLKKLKNKCPKIFIEKINVKDKNNLNKFILDADIVVIAVPGFLGFNTLKNVIQNGKNVVDISFSPENALELHNLAVKNNVTAIIDCGVAPGINNLILGYYNSIMEIESFICYVGGLPKERKWPFEYKAPFSPIDVIEEYIRPARFIENGKLVVKEALSDPELLFFDNIGTVEAFNTDGLRSILYTMKDIPNLKEKTIRYPGHMKYIKALKESAFFNKENINFTSKVLFNEWKLKEDDIEFTIMRIIIKGKKDEKKIKVIYNLYDETDTKNKISSMARTTGYACTAAVNMLANGLFNKKGVFPPELFGNDKNCFDFIMKYLKERNINFNILWNYLQ